MFLRATCPVSNEKGAVKKAHKISYRVDQVWGPGRSVDADIGLLVSDRGLVFSGYPRLRRKAY